MNSVQGSPEWIPDRTWEEYGPLAWFADAAEPKCWGLVLRDLFNGKVIEPSKVRVIRERRIPVADGAPPLSVAQLVVEVDEKPFEKFTVPLQIVDGEISVAYTRPELLQHIERELQQGWHWLGPDAIPVAERELWRSLRKPDEEVVDTAAAQKVCAMRLALKEGAENEWAVLRTKGYTSLERFEFICEQAQILAPKNADALVVAFFEEVKVAREAQSPEIHAFHNEMAKHCPFKPALYGYAQHMAAPDPSSPSEQTKSAFDRLTGFLDVVVNRLHYKALELLPFTKSPQVDAFFDVSDYMSVDPSLGGDDAHATFMKKAVELGVLVITDLVANHVSSEHRWIEEILNGKESAFDRIITWDDARKIGVRIARGEKDQDEDVPMPGAEFNVFLHTKGDQGKVSHLIRYFPHNNPHGLIHYIIPDGTFRHGIATFMNPDQVDVNVAHPEVLRHHMRALGHWANKGHRGTRIDAATHVGDEPGTYNIDLPKARAFMAMAKSFSTHVAPGSVLLPEANVTGAREGWLDPQRDFDGKTENTAADIVINFPAHVAIWETLILQDKTALEKLQREIGLLPPGKSFLNYLNLHDEIRAPNPLVHARLLENGGQNMGVGGVGGSPQVLLGGNQRLALGLALAYACKGHPATYYKDLVEIGNNDRFFEESMNLRMEAQERRGEARDPNRAQDPRDLDRGPVPIRLYEEALEKRLPQVVTTIANNELWDRRSAARTNRIDVDAVSNPDPSVMSWVRLPEEGESDGPLLQLVNLSEEPKTVRLRREELDASLPGFSTSPIWSDILQEEIDGSPCLLEVSSDKEFVSVRIPGLRLMYLEPRQIRAPGTKPVQTPDGIVDRALQTAG